jgi:hypothetical protein
MDLLWKPVVHSTSRVDIHEVAISYDAAALEGWIAAYEPWVESDRTDYSVWGAYAELASSGRFLLPYRHERPSRRFAEKEYHDPTSFTDQSIGLICEVTDQKSEVSQISESGEQRSSPAGIPYLLQSPKSRCQGSEVGGRRSGYVDFGLRISQEQRAKGRYSESAFG